MRGKDNVLLNTIIKNLFHWMDIKMHIVGFWREDQTQPMHCTLFQVLRFCLQM